MDNTVVKYAFDLVDESTLEYLLSEDPDLLPHKNINVPKDVRWNMKSINSEMYQGILNGESIDKISERLSKISNMNKNSAIRNARTMCTSAENRGRLDSYRKATEDGIIMKKVWIATGDDRTRDWHLDIDGEEVDIEEPWVNYYGEIMYPGDPSADPQNVWNCRCASGTHIIGFKKISKH